MQPHATKPKFSIVIPTRNEAADIGSTLEACLAMDYEPKEIIVVDDSTDHTPEIVCQYAGRGVRLIHREVNENGCCGARNRGMQSATGDYIVIINADDLPEKDYLNRLSVHYQNGADYVIVRSVVANQDNRWGRFVQAYGYAYPAPDPEWSEGFSCRREAAASVGYIPGDFPVPFCRDYLIGVALNKAGYTKHVDYTISMAHTVPATLRDFWRNRVWRGSFSAPFQYYLKDKPIGTVGLRESLRLGRTVAKYLLIVPFVSQVIRILRAAPKENRKLLDVLVGVAVNDAATIVGNIRGFNRLRGQLKSLP